MAIIQMKPKAKMSKHLKKSVKKAGGLDKHRAIQGYLPSGYNQSPKKYKLNLLQKARVRRMHKSMFPATFKRVYGFPIKK